MPEKSSLRSNKSKSRPNNQPKCQSCDGIIDKNDLYLKCCDCHYSYHIQCVNVSEKLYRKTKKNEWSCNDHEDEDEDNDDNQYQIERKLDSIFKQLKEITKSQDFLSGKHDDVIEQLKLIRDENKNQRQDIASLKKQQHQMRNEIEELKAKINTVEQNKTGDKVIVRGIKDQENPKNAIEKIAGIIGVELGANDIVFANQSTQENKAPTITAKFSSQHKKNEFIKAAKQKRLSTQMYGYDGDSKPIFVDEQLTKYTYTLFAQAKNLKKFGIKHVWVSNGDVLFRQTDDSQTKRINSSTQINEIEKSLTLSKQKVNNKKPNQQSTAAKQRSNKPGTANKHDKRKATHKDDSDEYTST